MLSIPARMKTVKRLCVSTPGYLAKKKKQMCPSKVTGQEYSGAVWGRHVHILIIDPLLSPCNSNLRTLLISFQKFQIRSNFFLSIMQSWVRSLGAGGKHTCLNRCSVGQFLLVEGESVVCIHVSIYFSIRLWKIISEIMSPTMLFFLL